MAFRQALIFLTVALAATASPTEHGFFLGMRSGEGLVGDAMDRLGQEMMMARRQLAQAGHICYSALARNRVPCNQRGQSYYNCGGHQAANPYTRGCTRATKCARISP